MDLIDRYVAKQYLKTFAAFLSGVCVVYLVIDFADRASSYQGPDWPSWTLRMYADRLPQMAVMLAPVAMLMAAGLTLSSLRRRLELLSLLAAGRSLARIVLPLVLLAGSLGAVVYFFNDRVAGQAALRAERISAEHFHLWGKYRAYFAPKRWLSLGPWIIHLGETLPGGGAREVSLFRLSSDFKLEERIDASALTPSPSGGWTLLQAQRRVFHELQPRLETYPELPLPVTGAAALFELAPGRPEMMSERELRRQIALRQTLGLDSREQRYESQSRWASLWMGMAGVLAAAALALRPERRGHVATTVIEGIGVATALFGLTALSRSLSLSGNLTPSLAAFLPVTLALLLGSAALYRVNARPSL